jgi:hypothetical protein
MHGDSEYYDGKKADIFSMGVCLFYIVTGLPPFAVATMIDRWYKTLVLDPKMFFGRV